MPESEPSLNGRALQSSSTPLPAPRKGLVARIGGLLSLALIVVAFGVIHRELKSQHFHHLTAYIFSFPLSRLALAAGLTVLNYLVLAGYDGLALRFIGRRLRAWQVLFTSFIAYVFSYNVGLSVFGGTAIRYRIYTGWNIAAGEIARIVAFNVATLWSGFLAVAGVVFLFEPVAIQSRFALPFATVRPLGFLFTGLAALYLMGSVFWDKPIVVRGRAIRLPPFRYALAQVAVSSVDWLLAGGVFYALMPSPDPVPFFAVLAVFLLAQLAGLISHVPGGLGVFEGAVLFLLSPRIPADRLFASLIVYRAVYYFLPLVVAVVFMAGHELYRKRAHLGKAADLADRWVWGFAPQLLAVAVFLGGMMLLASGATPVAAQRLDLLRAVFPLPVVEISHFLGSVVGALLLFLAWGLHRRLNGAYLLAVLLLVLGGVFSLLKGVDYEEAITLALVLAALWPSRKFFYRKTSLMNEPLTWGWFVAVAAALGVSTWLGLFAFKHVEYSQDLWWKFEFSADAPRFLRATLGAGSLALVLAFARLLRPPGGPTLAEDAADETALRTVVAGSPSTSAYLALLGDKRFLWSGSGRSFIMYGVAGRSWIAMGDPVGPEEEWPDLVWRFRELSDRHNSRPVFYEVGHERLYLYVDLGLTLSKLGEEARVPLRGFTLEGGDRKDLRYTNNRHDKEGFEFAVVPAESVPSLLTELKDVSDRWLSARGGKEKGFSLGFFRGDYLTQFPLALLSREGRTVAFANLWPGAGKEELSVDLMRYDDQQAPRGAMEYLFIKLMLWGSREGYEWFNLGMAPLSGLDNRTLAPAWSKIGHFIFRHGEQFYNFEGLRRFKEKFSPVWTPKYLAARSGLQLPAVLANVSTLISGGPKGLIVK